MDIEMDVQKPELLFGQGIVLMGIDTIDEDGLSIVFADGKEHGGVYKRERFITIPESDVYCFFKFPTIDSIEHFISKFESYKDKFIDESQKEQI